MVLSLRKLNWIRFAWSAAILVTLGIVAVVVLQSAIGDAAERAATARSQLIAQRVADQLAGHRRLLAAVSQNPVLLQLARSDTPADQTRFIASIKGRFPHALGLSVLPAAAHRIEFVPSWFDAACEQMVHLARRNPVPELHQPPQGPAHISLVHPLRDRHTNSVAGYLLLGLDPQSLSGALTASQPAETHIRFTRSTDASAGVVAIEGANFGVRVTGDGGWLASTPNALTRVLIGLTITLGLLIVGNLLVDRLSVKVIRGDIGSVARKFRDINDGEVRDDYPIRLLEFQRLSKYVSRSGGKLIKERRKLQDMGLTDHLSQLPNRRAFEAKLQQLWIQSRVSVPPSLLLLDLDHFKQVNDNFGHDAGDMLISMFARELRDCVRDSDFVARLGGDEFCIVFPYTKLEIAEDLAQRLRKNLPKILELRPGVDYLVSWTGGLSAMDNHDQDFGDIVKRADLALYAAKEAGRNQTQLRRFQPDNHRSMQA